MIWKCLYSNLSKSLEGRIFKSDCTNFLIKFAFLKSLKEILLAWMLKIERLESLLFFFSIKSEFSSFILSIMLLTLEFLLMLQRLFKLLLLGFEQLLFLVLALSSWEIESTLRERGIYPFLNLLLGFLRLLLIQIKSCLFNCISLLESNKLPI